MALDAGSLWRALHPLQAGTVLGGLTLSAVEDSVIVLRAAQGPIRLRVTPPLSDDDGPGLIVDSGMPGDVTQRQILAKVVRLLMRTLKRSVVRRSRPEKARG